MARQPKRTNPKRRVFRAHINISRKPKAAPKGKGMRGAVRLKIGKKRTRMLRAGEVVRPTDIIGVRPRISKEVLEPVDAKRYYVVYGKRKPNNFVRAISRAQATLHLESGSVVVTAARARAVHLVDESGVLSVKTMNAADSLVITESSPAAPLWIMQCAPEGYIERKRLQLGMPLIRKNPTPALGEQRLREERSGYRVHGSVSGRLPPNSPADMAAIQDDLEDMLRKGQDKFKKPEPVGFLAKLAALWEQITG